MLLVPTYCPACSRTALQPVPSDGTTRCAACKSESTVMPGEIYRASDEALFQRLSELVHDAQLSFRAASRISTELKGFGGSGVARAELVLQRIVDWQPSLYPVEPLLLADPGGLPRGLSMLRTIVTIEMRHAEARSTPRPGPCRHA